MGPSSADLHRLIDQFLGDHPPDSTPDRVLREARFDAGLAFVSFRAGCGGLGAEPAAQRGVDRRFAEAGCPDWTDRNVIGLGMAAATLHRHGSRSQLELLRPLFSGEHIWCQLFSEPGAGSDLAALATSARRVDDGWVVNGQKVWTSLGHVARYGILLARTDPALPKHRGLTYFVLDMSLPGVEVRPLRQLTGESEFNEVFLSDVRLPDSAVVGAVNGGWAVAMTTLSSERSALGEVAGGRGSGPISQAIELWQSAERVDELDPILLDRLMTLWCRSEAARLMNAAPADGPAEANETRGSLAKLQMAETNQAIYDLCLDLLGRDGVRYESYENTRPDSVGVHGDEDVRRAFLRTLANSIEGGTSEIQRTIIGERLLGLEPEPRLDKSVPWRESRRS